MIIINLNNNSLVDSKGSLCDLTDFILWESKQYQDKINKAFDQMQFRLKLGIKAI